MRNYAVAVCYARALLALGLENGRYQVYRAELVQACDLLAAGGAFAVLGSPIYPLDFRKGVLNGILAKMALEPDLANFLRLLLDKSRFACLGEISRSYAQLVDEVDGIKEARLLTAAPMSPSEQEAVARALGAFSGADIRLTVIEDPELIGGMVATIGDLVIDGSVRTQIRNFTRSLTTR